MMIFYRVLYRMLQGLVLILKPLLTQDLKKWVALRQISSQKMKTHPLQNVIWFHAASGEIEYCKSIIREVKKQQPEAVILVSYTSPSAEKLFQNITDEVSAFVPLCWDTPSDVQQWIEFYKPRALVFSRTDLWPELIHQCLMARIPLFVAAYNPRLSTFKNIILKKLLNGFSGISCVREDQASALQNLLPSQTGITADGDTRFDQVFHRLSQTSKINITSENEIFCLGSVWPEDLAYFYPQLVEIKKAGYALIISPHHVDEQTLRAIQNKLGELRLTYRLLSEQLTEKTIRFDYDVLIVDRIGYLADCYRFSCVAFVGGSFKERVHSVMEPLCCGLPVFVGPHYRNNPEAVRYLGRYVHELTQNTSFLAERRRRTQTSAEEIRAEMQKNLNASSRFTTALLSKILKI